MKKQGPERWIDFPKSDSLQIEEQNVDSDLFDLNLVSTAIARSWHAVNNCWVNGWMNISGNLSFSADESTYLLV